jgi:microcystin-dependent protein
MKRLFLFLFVLLCLAGLAVVPVQADEPYVGEIRMWAGYSTPPDGWMACGGQEISRTTYADLFGVIGTQFGNGDGTKTFNIPDLRNRFPLGVSVDPPINALGATGGEMEHTLTVAEMPSHRHSLGYSNIGGGGSNRRLRSYTWSWSGLAYTSYEGGGEPHNNMPPYLAVYFIIYTGNLSATPTPTPTPTSTPVPITGTTYLPYVSAYTHTLSSGNVLTVPVYFTFGEIAIAGATLLVLASFCLLLLFRTGAK